MITINPLATVMCQRHAWKIFIHLAKLCFREFTIQVLKNIKLSNKIFSIYYFFFDKLFVRSKNIWHKKDAEKHATYGNNFIFDNFWKKKFP